MGILKAFLERAAQKQNRAALIELCDSGLLTCTRGQPGEDGATYAVAWEPLDHPDQFPADVRRRHEENMRRLEEDQ